MKTAREMFEELGYKEVEDSFLTIRFRKPKGKEIIFFHNYEAVLKESSIAKNELITMEELQVINQMCKELGWLNE